MIQNVTQGWRTSLIGLVMIGSGIATVFMGKATWTEAIIAITMGVGFLFSPDSIIKKATKDGSNNDGQDSTPTPQA